ncbi:MAG: CvpA family protein [Bacteroidales bacterium]|nr:CvpA family protein [Bacteroidales bacterium]
MNAVDIVLVAVLIFFAIRGLFNGLIQELAGVIAWVLGLYLAINFSSWLNDYLATKWDISGEYMGIACLIIIFLAVLIGVRFLSKALTRFASAISLQWLNKIAGLVFGFMKGCLLLGGLCYLVNKFSVGSETMFSESFVFNELLHYTEKVFA